MSFFLLLAHLESIPPVCRHIYVCMYVCVCSGSMWMCEGIVGRCLCNRVTWYGLSQPVAGGIEQEIHSSCWIPKRWHLILEYPTDGSFFSASTFRGWVVSPYQTGWLRLTAKHRFPPAARVRGCAEVSVSALGYYGPATLIQHNSSAHLEVKQMCFHLSVSVLLSMNPEVAVMRRLLI